MKNFYIYYLIFCFLVYSNEIEVIELHENKIIRSDGFRKFKIIKKENDCKKK